MSSIRNLSIGRILTVAASLLIVGPAASAGVIVAPGSTWEYTFTLGPTSGNADWNNETNATNGAETDWSVGGAPFSNCTSCPDANFNRVTDWPADGSDGDDLWVRLVFDATGIDLSTLRWDLGVDNGYKLYLNGNSVSAANAEGFTSRWEYTGDFSGVTVNPGLNVLAVALEDHGVLTAFDMQVTGAPVPEPGTLLLLGSGLTGLALRRRKGRQG